MPAITILAIGTMKRGGQAHALDEYVQRIRWPLAIKVFDLKDSHPEKLQEKESAALLSACPKDAFIIALDERGKTLKSSEFSAKLQEWRQIHNRPLAFLIGGADGHHEHLRKKADFLLSFGTMTWPHRLARIMLVEQLYRAQQIAAGHPYHRE